jgi:hypothetical protein
VETQRQLVHVNKRLVGKLADRVLADAGKQRIAQLVEAPLANAGHIVGKHQHDRGQRPGRKRPQKSTGVELAVQRIGGELEEVRHQDQHQLGQHQEQECPDDAHLQVRPVRWPHVRPQVADGVQR